MLSSPSVGSATGRHARGAHGQPTGKSTSSFSLLRAFFGSFLKIPAGGPGQDDPSTGPVSGPPRGNLRLVALGGPVQRHLRG